MAATSYQLFIEVSAPCEIAIGRLGIFAFAAGRYVYTGSARRGLEARIARHLRREKKLRWHIDYLLSASGVSVTRVRRSRIDECSLNQQTGGTTPVAGFGASDCSGRCSSHLRYLGPRI